MIESSDNSYNDEINEAAYMTFFPSNRGSRLQEEQRQLKSKSNSLKILETNTSGKASSQMKSTCMFGFGNTKASIPTEVSKDFDIILDKTITCNDQDSNPLRTSQTLSKSIHSTE